MTEPTPRVVWCGPDGSWGETALDTPVIILPSEFFTVEELEEIGRMSDGDRYDYMRGKHALAWSHPDMFREE